MTVKEVPDLVDKFAPSVLCLVETRLWKTRIENLQDLLVMIIVMLS